MVHSHT